MVVLMKKPKNRTRMKHEHGYKRHQQVHELNKRKRGERQRIEDDIEEQVMSWYEMIHNSFNEEE